MPQVALLLRSAPPSGGLEQHGKCGGKSRNVPRGHIFRDAIFDSFISPGETTFPFGILQCMSSSACFSKPHENSVRPANLLLIYIFFPQRSLFFAVDHRISERFTLPQRGQLFAVQHGKWREDILEAALGLHPDRGHSLGTG